MNKKSRNRLIASTLLVFLLVLTVSPVAFADTVDYITGKGDQFMNVLKAIAKFGFPVGAFVLAIGLAWVNDSTAIRNVKIAIGALVFFSILAWGSEFVQNDIEKTVFNTVDMYFNV
jgi:hypothetical protein